MTHWLVFLFILVDGTFAERLNRLDSEAPQQSPNLTTKDSGAIDPEVLRTMTRQERLEQIAPNRAEKLRVIAEKKSLISEALKVNLAELDDAELDVLARQASKVRVWDAAVKFGQELVNRQTSYSDANFSLVQALLATQRLDEASRLTTDWVNTHGCVGPIAGCQYAVADAMMLEGRTADASVHAWSILRSHLPSLPSKPRFARSLSKMVRIAAMASQLPRSGENNDTADISKLRSLINKPGKALDRLDKPIDDRSVFDSQLVTAELLAVAGLSTDDRSQSSVQQWTELLRRSATSQDPPLEAIEQSLIELVRFYRTYSTKTKTLPPAISNRLDEIQVAMLTHASTSKHADRASRSITTIQRIISRRAKSDENPVK